MSPINHHFQSAIADDPDAAALGEVLPSNWNEGHDVTSVPMQSYSNPLPADGDLWYDGSTLAFHAGGGNYDVLLKIVDGGNF